MFWPLLFAHFIADYPLQTDGIVKAKKHWPGLTLHVAIHLVTMLVIVFGIVRADWRVVGPFVLALAVLHFGIDTGKNTISKLKPNWIVVPYLLDQVFHMLSILLVAYWIAQAGGVSTLAIQSSWMIYAIAYVLVTHVWFITERVLVYANKAYQHVVNAQMWSRMVTRAALLTLLLLGWNLWGGGLLITALIFQWPYRSGQYQWRTLSTDVGVVLGAMIFILLALSPS